MGAAKIDLLKPGARGAVSLFALALVADVAGQLLRGGPADPDVLMSGAVPAGAFLVFVFWALSVVAWGWFLAARLGFEKNLGGAVAALALGTLGASASTMVLGHLGLIGPTCSPLFTCLLLAGHGLNVWHHTQSRPSRQRPPRGRLAPGTWAALAALGALVSYSLARAFLPSGMSDALRYHATGPRVWSDAGRIFFPTSLPLLYLCSYWEYLSLWGQALLGGPGGGGLIEGLLFGQWTHVVFGFGGAALALRVLLGRFEDDAKWAWAATLAAVATPQLYPASWLANNDWGIIFWTVAGASLLFDGMAVLGGVCLGFACAGKFSAGFTALPALVVWWIAAGPRAADRRVRNEKLARAVGALAIVAAPIMARNVLATANPFYPALGGVFPGPWLGPMWEAHQRLYETGSLARSAMSAGVKLVDLFKAMPLWLGAAVLAVPFLGARARRLAPLWALAALSYLTFCLLVHEGNDYLRLAGTALCLFPAAALLTLVAVSRRFAVRGARAARRRELGELAACAALCALLVWSTPVSLGILRDLVEAPSPTLAIREMHLGGDAMAWLRLNAKSGDAIATTGANQVYELQPHTVAVITEQPALDRQTIFRSPVAILRVLRQYGYRYLFDGRHWGSFYWSTLAERLARLTIAHPDSFAYTGKGGDVIDLARLEAAVLPDCDERVEF